jgi:hypothetical protein
MQRSSPSIAALATALAKAQIELANPEKSLVGTIEPQAGEGGARLFRYAPLSSGLEIVRKTLGQHEIATVQTTAIDRRPASSISPPFWRTPQANGLPRTVRSVRLLKLNGPTAWVQH